MGGEVSVGCTEGARDERLDGEARAIKSDSIRANWSSRRVKRVSMSDRRCPTVDSRVDRRLSVVLALVVRVVRRLLMSVTACSTAAIRSIAGVVMRGRGVDGSGPVGGLIRLLDAPDTWTSGVLEEIFGAGGGRGLPLAPEESEGRLILN